MRSVEAMSGKEASCVESRAGARERTGVSSKADHHRLSTHGHRSAASYGAVGLQARGASRFTPRSQQNAPCQKRVNSALQTLSATVGRQAQSVKRRRVIPLFSTVQGLLGEGTVQDIVS